MYEIYSLWFFIQTLSIYVLRMAVTGGTNFFKMKNNGQTDWGADESVDQTERIENREYYLSLWTIVTINVKEFQVDSIPSPYFRKMKEWKS